MMVQSAKQPQNRLNKSSDIRVLLIIRVEGQMVSS